MAPSFCSASARKMRLAVRSVPWATHEVLGSYILDLAAIGKGKSIESVKVSLTADKRGVIVNQFTRGLPPTVVPTTGGVVDFDHRFAEQATCAAFRVDPELDR
jgi:hypothetical protein